MEIVAELDSVEFYKTKKSCTRGIYKITEHDGDINYCELNGFGGENWYSETEFEMKKEELHQELMFDINMAAMDSDFDVNGDPWCSDPGLDNPLDFNDCDGCMSCHGCCAGEGDDCRLPR